MARYGVTYNDVANAANQLKGMGKNPTIEAVRSILRTGSIGTINKHLRQWKSSQEQSYTNPALENPPEEFMAFVKGLWERLITTTKEKLEPNHASQIAELQQTLEKYKASNSNWQKMYSQWQQQKAQLLNTINRLEQELELARGEKMLHETFS